MDTGLGGWAAHHADRLARALAIPGVGLGSLAADRQATQVTNPAVAFDALQTLEVHANFPPKVTLDDVLAVLDRVNNLRKLLLGQVLGANARVNAGLGENVARVTRADAVDIPQSDVDTLVGRNFNADDTSHTRG